MEPLELSKLFSQEELDQVIPTHLRLDKIVPKMLKYAEQEFNQWFLSVLKAIIANGKLAEAVLKQGFKAGFKCQMV